MDDEKDELQSQIDSPGLYVDLRDLMLPDTHLRYFGGDKKQVLTLKALDKNLKIEITRPDKLFEWFIEVMDLNGQNIASTWVEHFGKSNEELKKEMRKEIEEFIKIVSENNTRVISGNLNSNKFQYFNGQTWSDFDIF